MIGEAWGWLDPVLVDLIDRPAAGVALQGLALLIAAGVGAVHALGPGHGKVLVGAYLAGTSARLRDAARLGVVVALMHTGSTLLLGLLLFRAQDVRATEAFGPAAGALAGLAVATVGGVLLWRQRSGWRARRRVATPDDRAGVTAGEPDGAARAEASGHGDGHHHDLPAGVPPLSRAGIAALATTGGLLPSPAAFLVLTTALALGRGGYGLALIAAFGVGMALTLTAVGVAAITGRRLLVDRAPRHRGVRVAAALLPRLSAVGILLGGAVIAGASLRSWWLLHVG